MVRVRMANHNSEEGDESRGECGPTGWPIQGQAGDGVGGVNPQVRTPPESGFFAIRLRRRGGIDL
jgi:hypothetical protein